LVLQEVPGWPLEAIHDQVRRSIDVVVHVGRSVDNQRRVMEVVEADSASTGVQLRPLADGATVSASLKRRRQ
jgi:Flp pilus assembly CpaF family ATPase